MKKILYCALAILLFSSACKNDYFEDSGIHQAKYAGTIMDYLDAHSKRPEDLFDTLTQVIRIAGLDEVLRNEKLTFFAPPDPSINKALKELNMRLYSSALDTVRFLDEVKPEVWREFLSDYIIRGDFGLIDFRQLDTAALYAYPGQIFKTYGGASINVGVIYHDLKNGDVKIKYQGPRQIFLSYVPDYSLPSYGWYNAPIATSNIQPTNGRLHVINYVRHQFGFAYNRFSNLAIERGIDYKKQ